MVDPISWYLLGRASGASRGRWAEVTGLHDRRAVAEWVAAGVRRPEDAAGWMRHQCPPMKAAWYVALGIGPVDHVAWERSGLSFDEMRALRWASVEPSALSAWSRAVGGPRLLLRWVKQGFALREAAEWNEAGHRQPEAAARWKAHGIPAASARRWSDAGASPDAAVRWLALGLGEDIALRLAAAGFSSGTWKKAAVGGLDVTTALRWIGVGAPAAVIEEWSGRWDIESVQMWTRGLDCGIEDAWRWKERFGVPSEAAPWRAMGLTPPEAREWADQGITPAAARVWDSSEISAKEARRWSDLGIDVADAVRWRSIGVGPKLVHAARASGLADDQCRRWAQVGVREPAQLDRVRQEWRLDDAERWTQSLGGDLTRASGWRAVEPDLDRAAAWAAEGASERDVPGWSGAGFGPRAFGAWMRAGYRLREAVAWSTRGVTVGQAVALAKRGCTDPSTVDAGAELGMTVTTVLEWANLGVTDPDRLRRVSAQWALDEAQAWCARLQADLAGAEAWAAATQAELTVAAALAGAGVSTPAEAGRWLASGSIDDALRWLDAGADDVDVAEAYTTAAGSTGAGIAWLRAKVDLHGVRAWVAAGFDAGDGVRWMTTGFAPQDARVWVSHGVDLPAEAGAWHDLGMEPSRVPQLRQLGITCDSLARAARAGVEPDALVAAEALDRLGLTVHDRTECAEIERLSPAEIDVALDRLVRFAAATGSETVAVRHGAPHLDVALMAAVPDARYLRGGAKAYLWRQLGAGFTTTAGTVDAAGADDAGDVTLISVSPRRPAQAPEAVVLEILDG